MRKIFLSAIVGVAFLAGTLTGTMNFADATGKWKTLFERVDILEGLIKGNSIRTVILHDDDAGHAAGWNPQGANEGGFLATYTIEDDDVGSNSIIIATVNNQAEGVLHNQAVPCATAVIMDTGSTGFNLSCKDEAQGIFADAGSVLTYVVIKP